MTYPSKHYAFLALTFFTISPSSSYAQEYTGMTSSDKTYKQKDDTHNNLNIFVRMGALISSGTIFDESSSHQQSYPFTSSKNITQDDFSSTGIVLSFGMKLKQKRKSGLQIIGVIKSGYDNTNNQEKLSFTQFGSAMEIYYGNKKAKLLLGTLLSYGVTVHPSAKDEETSYVALEPYIGLEIAMTDHMAILTKVGYEWRDYEKVSYQDLTTSHTSKLSAYNITGSLLLEYAF